MGSDLTMARGLERVPMPLILPALQGRGEYDLRAALLLGTAATALRQEFDFASRSAATTKDGAPGAGEVTARAPCRASHRSTLVLAAFSLTAAVAVAVASAIAGRLARRT